MTNIAKILLVITMAYIGVANTIWSIRNPTANEIQNIIYIKSVLTFSKEDKFQ
jgi:hypothetical protein